MIQQNTEEEAPQLKQTAPNKSSEILMKSRNLVLEIHLGLRYEDSHPVVSVDQSIPLPSILEPMFVKDGAKTVEGIVRMLGVDTFERMVREFFLSKADEMYTTNKFVEHKTLVDTLKDDQAILELDQGSGGAQKILVKPIVSEETNLIVEMEDVEDDVHEQEVPEEYQLDDGEEEEPKAELVETQISEVPPPKPPTPSPQTSTGTVLNNSSRKPIIR